MIFLFFGFKPCPSTIYANCKMAGSGEHKEHRINIKSSVWSSFVDFWSILKNYTRNYSWKPEFLTKFSLIRLLVTRHQTADIHFFYKATTTPKWQLIDRHEGFPKNATL
jgi:hypothetical protein